MNQKGGNIFGLFFIFFIIGALVFLLMWISQNPVEIPLFLGLALPIVAIGIFVMLFGVLWGSSPLFMFGLWIAIYYYWAIQQLPLGLSI